MVGYGREATTQLQNSKGFNISRFILLLILANMLCWGTTTSQVDFFSPHAKPASGTAASNGSAGCQFVVTFTSGPENKFFVFGSLFVIIVTIWCWSSFLQLTSIIQFSWSKNDLKVLPGAQQWPRLGSWGAPLTSTSTSTWGASWTWKFDISPGISHPNPDIDRFWTCQTNLALNT